MRAQNYTFSIDEENDILAKRFVTIPMNRKNLDNFICQGI